MTGLTWSSDRRTMFVGIQHPGDDGGDWPDHGGALAALGGHRDQARTMAASWAEPGADW